MNSTSESKKWKEPRGHKPNQNEEIILPTSLHPGLTEHMTVVTASRVLVAAGISDANTRNL